MPGVGTISRRELIELGKSGKLKQFGAVPSDPVARADFERRIEAWGAKQEGAYTIDIPGLSDVIRLPIPSLDNPDLKRERVQRFKSAVSPVPEVLRWIPRMINFLDDVQDLAITGLFLARPILRRLPLRFIPFVGWGLIALDGINLINGLISTALTGPLNKSVLKSALKGQQVCLVDPKKAFANFMKPLGWRRLLGVVLQGGQALATLTGYGLSLGSIMGAISDTFWGAIRALGGSKVTFRGPPPSDPSVKAARVLSHAAEFNFGGDVFSPDDHLLMLIGLNLAVDFLAASNPVVLDSRLDQLMTTEVPAYVVWEPSSRLALQEAGLNPDDPGIPLSHTGLAAPTYETLLLESLGRVEDWDGEMAWVFEDEEVATIAWWLQDEAGSDILECLTGIPSKDYMAHPLELMAAIHLAEEDIWPPENAEPLLYFRWLMLAIDEARRDNLRMPRLPHWQRAALTLWGRYRRRGEGLPPKEFDKRRCF